MNHRQIIGVLAGVGVALLVLGVALIGGAFSGPEADCSPDAGSNGDVCETAQASSTQPTSDTVAPDTSTQPSNQETTTSTSPETTTSSNAPTTEPVESPPPGSGECSIVLGMSQINEVYHGSSLSTSGKWMSHISSGTPLAQWANPDGRPWVDFTVRNECGQPTHASFGFDPGERALDPSLSEAVANIKAWYPTVETVDVWLLVGAEENGEQVTCTMNGKPVRATTRHADRQGELATFLAQHPDILAGPDINVTCDGFRDNLGHLSASGEAAAGAQFDAFYG